MSDELKHLLFKLIQANSYSSEENFIKLHNEFCQAIDALLARADRAEAMVERLIEAGNALDIPPDDFSEEQKEWREIVTEWCNWEMRKL